MAFNPAPSNWLGAGYVLTSNSVGFNTNDSATNKTLPQLTTAEANATSGNIREVIFAMVEAFYQAYITKDTVDRPTKLTISRNGNTTSTGNINYVYNFQIEVSPTAVNVANEA